MSPEGKPQYTSPIDAALEGKPSLKHVQGGAEKTSRLEKMLERIQFDVLREVCVHKLEELGVEQEPLQFVEKEKIFEVNKFLTFLARAGSYDKENKTISINPHLSELAEKLTYGKESAEEVFLSALCHEESHALSHQSCSAWEETPIPFVEKSTRYLGFEESPKVRLAKKLTLHPDMDFVLFNEGVTDILGNELFNAYNEKVPSSNPNPPKYYKAYPAGRMLVQTVVTKIAKECNLENVEVMNALQKAYLVGELITGDFMKRLFKETMPDSLVNNLKNADGFVSSDFVLGVMKIRFKKWSEDDRKRIRRWITANGKKNKREKGSGGVE